MIARLIWFIIGVLLIVGAVTLTAHFARAGVLLDKRSLAGEQDERAPVPPEVEGMFCKADPKGEACKLSVARQQIGICIEYGDKIRRTTPDRRDDWLYFCMQQKHWQLCDDCITLQDGAPSCRDAGTAAYYSESCWTWSPPNLWRADRTFHK